jgi:hypothetical protein
MELPNDPTIPILGIYLKNQSQHTTELPAYSFLLQSTSHNSHDWISLGVHQWVNTMIFFFYKTIMSFAGKHTELENITLKRSKPDSERQNFTFSHICRIQICVYVCVCVVLEWTQGLHLEPFLQAFIVIVFFRVRISRTICPDWLQTTILLISASWVAGIIDVNHQRLPWNLDFLKRTWKWKEDYLGRGRGPVGWGRAGGEKTIKDNGGGECDQTTLYTCMKI